MTPTKEMIETGAIALAEYDAPTSSTFWGKIDHEDRRGLEAAYRRRSEACLKAVLLTFPASSS